jgi:hypothetical protein
VRDKSGGSLSTIQSDDGEEWMSILELPDSLSRCSLYRDVSGCSSIGTPWSFLSPRGPADNASALDPMFARPINETLMICNMRVREEHGTERLDYSKSDLDEGNNEKTNEQESTQQIPGFNSPWDFKRMLFYGTCSADPPNANKVVAFGGISNCAFPNSSTWPYPYTEASGLHVKTITNHPALPFPWTAAPGPKTCLAPSEASISRERLPFQDQHRLTTKAKVDPCAHAGLPPKVDVLPAPSPPPVDNNATLMKKKRASNAVPEERIYVLDGCQDYDVLCGKGERINQHPGHKLFHKEKVHFQDRYRGTTIKKEKTALAEQLLDTMARKYGSRFLALCPEKQRWYVISRERAMREKFTAEQRRLKRLLYSKPAKKRGSQK